MQQGWTPTRQLSRRMTITTAVVAVVLTLTTAFLVVTLYRQSNTLSENTLLTSDIVNANARTIGQVQIEILRLSKLIAAEETDSARLELHRGFVGQRIDEATLDHQLNTLGSTELLDRTRSLDRVWHATVQPQIQSIIDDPSNVSPQQQAQALTSLENLERKFNSVSTDGEQNRKEQAIEAGQATERSLRATEMAELAIAVLLLGMLAFVGVALAAFRRTARHQDRAALRLAEMNDEMRMLSHVASNTDNMVVITDADGFTEWVNDAFTRATGYSFEDVKGLRPGWVLQGPGTDMATVDELRRHLLAGESHTCELLNYAKDGREYWVELEVQPVRNDDGVLTNFIAIESDTTHRREAEDQLVKAKDAAESLAAEKASFLASMSHEIRTPLNSVIGLTGLLLDTDLSESQREYAATARNSGTMLLSIVNNILNYSALEAGNMDADPVHFSLEELLRRSVNLVSRQATMKGLDIHIDVSKDLPAFVVGDETRLQQVLVNLVANAVKFTERGEIVVSAHRPSAATESDTVVIRVVDTGIGIPADRMHRLFKPFSQIDASTTRRYGGTGLGLAISHHIVSLLGGEIGVTSRPNVGTIFEITLPLPTGDAQGVATDQIVAASAVGRTLRILVAEDDKVNQLVLSRMLERLGHRADVVSDGLAAIEIMGRNRYDVVLMDVQMPRLDGTGATQRIRAQLPSDAQPVIVAVTASALEGDREKLLAAGMDLYLSKPIQLQALSSILNEVHRRRMTATLGPAVDAAAHRDMTGEDDDLLLGQLVATFVTAAEPMLDDLLTALAENDPSSLQLGAHRLKDMAISVSAVQLAAVAERLESAAASAGMESVPVTISELADEFDRVRAWHRDRVRSTGPGPELAGSAR